MRVALRQCPATVENKSGALQIQVFWCRRNSLTSISQNDLIHIDQVVVEIDRPRLFPRLSLKNWIDSLRFAQWEGRVTQSIKLTTTLMASQINVVSVMQVFIQVKVLPFNCTILVFMSWSLKVRYRSRYSWIPFFPRVLGIRVLFIF